MEIDVFLPNNYLPYSGVVGAAGYTTYPTNTITLHNIWYQSTAVRITSARVVQVPAPLKDISMEFEIRPKFEVLWFEMYSANHKKNFAHVTTV